MLAFLIWRTSSLDIPEVVATTVCLFDCLSLVLSPWLAFNHMLHSAGTVESIMHTISAPPMYSTTKNVFGIQRGTRELASKKNRKQVKLDVLHIWFTPHIKGYRGPASVGRWNTKIWLQTWKLTRFKFPPRRDDDAEVANVSPFISFWRGANARNVIFVI